MTEYERIQLSLDQINAGFKALDDSIKRRLENHDKDIDTLYNARNDLVSDITRLNTELSLLKVLRDEGRDDLKLAADRIENLQEKLFARMDYENVSRNEMCKDIQAKLTNEIEYKFVNVNETVSEEIKKQALRTDNKMLSLKLAALVAGVTAAIAAISHLLTKYVFK